VRRAGIEFDLKNPEHAAVLGEAFEVCGGCAMCGADARLALGELWG
jgi:hypothetical protein